MNKETAKRVRLVYGIVLGIVIIAAGICLISACLSIYRSGGDQIYTAEKVHTAFTGIAAPIYLAIALVIFGFLLDLALPCSDKKLKAPKNPAATLERLLSKRDVEACGQEVKAAIFRERKRRKADRVITFVVLAVCSIGFLLYGANSANFHQTEINTSMVKAVAVLFGCLVLPLGCSILAAYRGKASLQREIDLVKSIPAGEKKAATAVPSQSKGLLVARCVLICAAIALLVYGFLAGGTADVLTKAVNICTECVGLG